MNLNLLTDIQLDTFLLLERTYPIPSIRQIARKQNRSKTSVEQTLDQLEAKGLIIRGNQIILRYKFMLCPKN